MIFVSQDPALLIKLIEGLLKFWPFASSDKEVLFLTELLEVLETSEINTLKPIIEKIFKRLIICVSS